MNTFRVNENQVILYLICIYLQIFARMSGKKVTLTKVSENWFVSFTYKQERSTTLKKLSIV